MHKPNGVANGSANIVSPKAKAHGLHTAEIDLAWPDLLANMKRPAGLVNNTMACYSNATLQVLLHTPPVLHMAIAHTDCESARAITADVRYDAVLYAV